MSNPAESDPRLRTTERGVVGRHDQIAFERKFEPEAEGRSPNRGDDGLVGQHEVVFEVLGDAPDPRRLGEALSLLEPERLDWSLPYVLSRTEVVRRLP